MPVWQVWRSKSGLRGSAYDWRNHPDLKVTPRSKPPQPQALVSTAEHYLGVPYNWGGTGKYGLDCSAFTNKVYAQNGYDLPRTSREQFKVGMEVTRNRLKTGDLLFFSSKPGNPRITHVAMYVDNGQFIHAASGKGEVSYDHLRSRYYDTRLVGARRIVSLPPGRYSTYFGTARRGALFASDSKAQDDGDLGKFPELGLQPLDGPPPNEDNPNDTSYTDEHGSDEIPLQLATVSDPSALEQVGPDLQLQYATTLGVSVGGGWFGDMGAVLVMPEFTYFGHDNGFRAAVAAPFFFPVGHSPHSTASLLHDGWNSVADYAKVLRQISYGQKESRLYIDLGRTASGTLGSGQLMRYFTPNIASSNLPRYALQADALSLSFDGRIDIGGFELFIDDVITPHALGASLHVKPGTIFHATNPLLRSLAWEWTYATDTRQNVHGIGTTLRMDVLQSKYIDFTPYVDTSALLQPNNTGIGGAFGLLTRARITDSGAHVMRLRLEGRISSATFVPSYFDATYALSRTVVAGDNPQTELGSKQDILAARRHGPTHWSAYGELTYSYTRQVTVGAAYEDGTNFGTTDNAAILAASQQLRRNFMLYVDLRDLYVPGMRQPLGLYLSYHLRNFHDAWPILTQSRLNEYLFAGMSFGVHDWVRVSASVRKSINLNDRTTSEWLGALALIIQYEL